MTGPANKMDSTSLPLRDFHLPSPIGWWPPGPGWWIVLLLSIAGALMVIWYRKHFTGLRIKKQAMRELVELRETPGFSDAERIGLLSALIRRVCLSYYPRAGVAALTGREWLRFLDQALGDSSFSTGPGLALLDAPYRQHIDVKPGRLFALFERWIGALPRRVARD